jgi:DNA-binding transcriptional MerR regulator
MAAKRKATDARVVQPSLLDDQSSEQGFRGPEVCNIVGITYRQLDYWARTGLLRPSLADAQGSGSQRRYSYRDLVALKVIKSLLDAGVALQNARTAIDYLRGHLGEDVASANLVLQGTDSVLVQSGDELIDVVRRGQGVLNIVPLGTVFSEIDSQIIAFTPPQPTVVDAPVAKSLER